MTTIVKAAVGLAVSLCLAGGVPVAAHHSFAAEFDDAKPIKMTGTITKVEWTNRISGSTLT